MVTAFGTIHIRLGMRTHINLRANMRLIRMCKYLLTDYDTLVTIIEDSSAC